MDASQVVLLATVLLPFAGAGAVILLRKLPNAREGASLAAGVGTFALVMGATMGVALSANLFSLFLFYEILTVATYPLVVHKETEEAFAAGRKYLVYTLTAGVAILAGMTLLQGMAGSVEFVAGGNPALAGLAPEFAKGAVVLLLGGFGVKAGLVALPR